MSRPAVTAAVVAATVVLIAALFYFLYPSTTVPPDRPITDADRGETARQTIAELREESAANGRVDYETAYEQAEAYREEGRLADAQLLYFFAAREGHPQAAFRLGTMNDPLHHDPATSLLPRADAFQAYKWYSQALDGGVSDAAGRLDALREWAEARAREGDPGAEQLLLQWN